VGLNTPARTYCASKVTLKRHFGGENIYAEHKEKRHGSISQIPDAIEEKLKIHILKLKGKYLELHT
jgi:hypothetical protein